MPEATILAAISALDAKLSTLDLNVTTLDAKVTTFRVDVLARFDRIENRLTTMQGDITVNMGRADSAHDAADHERDELRLMSTEVSALTRKTQRLEAQIHELTKPQA